MISPGNSYSILFFLSGIEAFYTNLPIHWYFPSIFYSESITCATIFILISPLGLTFLFSYSSSVPNQGESNHLTSLFLVLDHWLHTLKKKKSLNLVTVSWNTHFHPDSKLLLNMLLVSSLWTPSGTLLNIDFFPQSPYGLPPSSSQQMIFPALGKEKKAIKRELCKHSSFATGKWIKLCRIFHSSLPL